MMTTNEKRIVNLQKTWKSGLPLAKIAEKHGYKDEASLRRRISYLRSKGYEFPHRYEAKSDAERDAFDKKVHKLLGQGLARIDAARELKVSVSTINNSIVRLKRNGLISDNYSTFCPTRSDEDNQRLIAMYCSKAPLKQIAAAFHLRTPEAVSMAIQRLRDQGHRIPNRRRRH